MVLFKKQYLRQTIHRQIQIGVAIVSLSVCVLALILLTLSSFVIINLSYYDLISIIDEKENESLEGMGAYADMGLVNMVEMKKFTLEFIRRFGDYPYDLFKIRMSTIIEVLIEIDIFEFAKYLESRCK